MKSFCVLLPEARTVGEVGVGGAQWRPSISIRTWSTFDLFGYEDRRAARRGGGATIVKWRCEVVAGPEVEPDLVAVAVRV